MDPATPLISIIIPAHNTETFLARCLDSLLCQTLPDFELLLIDDGSTDGTAAIADRYAEADSRVKVIHKENGGVSSARNRGLEVAAGEFITFIDADDTVVPTYLEKLYGRLCETGADIAVARWSAESPTDKHIYGVATDRLYTQAEVDDIGLLGTCWAHLFRRASMTVFCFAGDIHYGEDGLFTIQNFYGKPGNKLVSLSDCLYIYNRGNPQSATAQGFRLERFSEIEAYQRMQKALQGYPDITTNRFCNAIWFNYRLILASGANKTYPAETAALRREFLENRKQILKLLPPRSRILPWLCARSERLGQWAIRRKDSLKNRKKKA